MRCRTTGNTVEMTQYLLVEESKKKGIYDGCRAIGSHKEKLSLIPSSHRRRIDGELNWRAKRRQSITKLNENVKTVIEREKALGNWGHSARAPKNFKLFENLRRSVTNCVKRGERIKAYQSVTKLIKEY